MGIVFSAAVTSTLSSGNTMVIYRQVTAGQALITVILLVLLVVELINLVQRYA